MKQPKKLKPPVKDTRKSLFIETESICTHNYRSDEVYGEWSSEHQCSVQKISRNRDLLNKWDFTEYKVPSETYDATTLYIVTVTYSSGDTFGSSSGNLAIAYITENSEEALKVRNGLGENINPNPEDPKSQCGGYAQWDGYFENIEGVDIVFLPVMG